MPKKGIRYTEEFKQQIVELYNSGNSVNYLSREYGVSNVTIYRWVKELSPVKVSEKDQITAKEYEKMKKRIAELEMENEILKKATAIFARKRSKKPITLLKHTNVYCKAYIQSFIIYRKFIL